MQNGHEPQAVTRARQDARVASRLHQLELERFSPTLGVFEQFPVAQTLPQPLVGVHKNNQALGLSSSSTRKHSE